MSKVGLNIGLQALLTARAALETVGHNVSNASTPGYSRQKLHVSANRPMMLRGLQIGGGVKADAVLRTVDELILRRIVNQVATVGRLDALHLGMKGVEALLGEPGGNGVGKLIDDLFGAVAELSTDAADPVFRTALVESTMSLTDHFQHLAEEAIRLRDDAAQRVQAFASDVNARAEEILGLNREIMLVESAGVVANDQRDQRDLALRELAREIDLTYHEDENGAVRVLVDGQLLVGPTTMNALQAQVGQDGTVTLTVEGGTQPVTPDGGRIAGLIGFAGDFLPAFQEDVRQLASDLILEFNRVHSTGIPAAGGFSHLTGSHALQDVDGDGAVTDERLADAGLPFTVTSGTLYVNVRDEASGALVTHTIDIDAAPTTVADLIAAFDAIPELSANLDSLNRLQVHADGGFTFDFAPRLNRSPDQVAGSFGSGRASHGSANQGPFNLTAGSTLDLTGPTSSFTVTFTPASFADMSQASAAEVAAAINADPNTGANLLRAVAVDDRVFLQSIGQGAAQSFTIDGGTALGTLGFTAATTVTGHDTSVTVEVHGEYSASVNGRWVFRPNIAGRVGTTAGLQVIVETAAGLPVALLDVGAGYVPGTELQVADGLAVSFTVGQLSVADGDTFVQELIADADTADALVGLGLNGFFVGTDAETIALRPDLASDPDLIATGFGGGSGDNGALLEMMALQHRTVAGLDATFTEFYGSLVGGIGFDIASAESSAEIEQFLTESLEARRDQVSGVNVDEELVDMIQYEQAFAAAAQFIQVVNGLQDEVLRLL